MSPEHAQPVTFGPSSRVCAGFAEPDNEWDQLMVPCVLPDPRKWDDALHARMVQLRTRGLKPQLFLPLAWLKQRQKTDSR